MRSEINLSQENLSNKAALSCETYDDGYLHVEHANYYVTCGGKPLYHLTRKEFLLLSRLARDIKRPVSKQTLWQCAWGVNTALNAKTFHVHIASLRRKLLPYGLDIVVAVHIGYRLARTANTNPETSTTHNTTNSQENLC